MTEALLLATLIGWAITLIVVVRQGGRIKELVAKAGLIKTTAEFWYKDANYWKAQALAEKQDRVNIQLAIDKLRREGGL